jgi:hypothetical protein
MSGDGGRTGNMNTVIIHIEGGSEYEMLAFDCLELGERVTSDNGYIRKAKPGEMVIVVVVRTALRPEGCLAVWCEKKL